DPQRLRSLDVPRHELVVDRALDEQPRPGEAHLALVAEASRHGPVEGGLQIGIGADDVGRLASQLERELLQGSGGVGHDEAAGGALPGERHGVDAGVLGKLLSRGVRPEPLDHVEHAGRQVRLGHDLGQDRGRDRALLGRLGHDRAAERERRGDLPGEQHQREVPGGDRGHYAKRLAELVGEDAGRRLVERPRRQVLGVVGEEAEVERRARNVPRPRLRDRLAHVERLPPGELVQARVDPFGDPVQVALPLGRAHPRPRPLVEGPARCLDRAGGIGPRALGHLRDLLVVDRAYRRKAPALERVDECVADEVSNGSHAHLPRTSTRGGRRARRRAPPRRRSGLRPSRAGSPGRSRDGPRAPRTPPRSPAGSAGASSQCPDPPAGRSARSAWPFPFPQRTRSDADPIRSISTVTVIPRSSATGAVSPPDSTRSPRRSPRVPAARVARAIQATAEAGSGMTAPPAAVSASSPFTVSTTPTSASPANGRERLVPTTKAAAEESSATLSAARNTKSRYRESTISRHTATPAVASSTSSALASGPRSASRRKAISGSAFGWMNRSSATVPSASAIASVSHP